MPQRPISRRALLRGAGVSLALPWLEGMSRAASQPGPPRRMLLVSNNLGVLPKPFFPTGSGANYELSPYLRELEEFRSDFTVFSGLSHPGVVGGHSTENCFLTGAKGPTSSGFRNQISLDQFAADRLGQQTRFATLNLGVNIDKANRSLSWTRDGVLLPAQDSAAALFRTLFVSGDAAAAARKLRQLREKQSILDAVLSETNQLNRTLGPNDRRRLDQYFTSIRELEERLRIAGEWETRPKPEVERVVPTDPADGSKFFDRFRLMLSMAQLALETDSTRIVTLMVDAFATGVFEIDEQTRTSNGYHNLSHHGQAAGVVAELDKVDRRQLGLVRELLANLAARPDGDARLLDRTMVLYGSNMGDANTHDNTNLPILLAGGGFRHGQHLTFRRDSNAPLCNLYVSMLQRLGVEADQFGSSSGTLSGLSVG